jgi:RimJ/RimL family protein N-acetyltransferase
VAKRLGTRRICSSFTVKYAPRNYNASRPGATDFLAQQFAAQRHHYRTRITGCLFMVIEHHGSAIGRLYLQERETRWQIVDIALGARQRGAGLGTAIIGQICAMAGLTGKGVGLFVEHDNAAQRLYRRLGFTSVRDAGVYAELEWLPGSCVAAASCAPQLNTAS